MKVIVGLGNPGAQYRATKHNIGFVTMDELAYREKVEFNQTKFEADVAQLFFNNEKVLLVKPQTYMNESGRAVRPLLDYYHVSEEDLLVVYDDMDLPEGTIRLREKGNAGGHNGVKSLIQHLGTNQFNRIKIGIGRPSGRETVVNYVLSPFHKKDHETMLVAVKTAADAVDYWLQGHSFTQAMNQFNQKKESGK